MADTNMESVGMADTNMGAAAHPSYMNKMNVSGNNTKRGTKRGPNNNIGPYNTRPNNTGPQNVLNRRKTKKAAPGQGNRPISIAHRKNRIKPTGYQPMVTAY